MCSDVRLHHNTLTQSVTQVVQSITVTDQILQNTLKQKKGEFGCRFFGIFFYVWVGRCQIYNQDPLEDFQARDHGKRAST